MSCISFSCGGNEDNLPVNIEKNKHKSKYVLLHTNVHLNPSIVDECIGTGASMLIVGNVVWPKICQVFPLAPIYLQAP